MSIDTQDVTWPSSYTKESDARTTPLAPVSVRDDAEAIYAEQERIAAAKARAVNAMFMAIRRTWTGMGARPDFDRFEEDVIDRFVEQAIDL